MAKTTKNEQEVVKEQPTRFVIMPFGGWFDKYYWKFTYQLLKLLILTLKEQMTYTDQAYCYDIWTSTKEAKVILADLTNKNPNVFYELGLAHAITNQQY
jgi:hypothetical protein